MQSLVSLDFSGDIFPLIYQPCDTCNAIHGGERHPYYDKENKELLNVCTDCLLFLANPTDYPKPEGF